MRGPRVNIIAAIGLKNELGKQNGLIWRISADLKRVKELTMGHPIIMGRKTYESIGHPLPGRTNIVISRSPLDLPGCLVSHSLEDALLAARSIDGEDVFIFGGASVYQEALPHADRLYLTEIQRTDAGADTFFPSFEEFSKELSRESHLEHEPPFVWRTLERVT